MKVKKIKLFLLLLKQINYFNQFSLLKQFTVKANLNLLKNRINIDKIDVFLTLKSKIAHKLINLVLSRLTIIN
jgi:hypothetical protein